MYQKPATPSSIGAVVDDAFRLYRAAFNRAWVPALMMQLMVTAVLVYIQSQSPQLKSEPMAWETVEPALLALNLTAVIASLLFFNAITAQLLAVREHEDLSIGASLATGARYFLPMLGLSLVLGAGALLFVVLASTLSAPLPGIARPGAIVLGGLIALYLFFRVSLAFVALLGDRLPVLEAVRTSWRITRENWWRAALVMLAVLLLFALALLALSLCSSFVTLLVRIDTVAGMMAVQLVAAVIQAATLPFFYAGFVAVYFDLKLRSGQTRPPGSDAAG